MGFDRWLRAVGVAVGCLAPQVALADLYHYDAALTLSFGGASGAPIETSGLVDVTAGGASGQKLVSLSLPASSFVGSGSFPLPTAAGVTLAGVPITSVQYTLANGTVQVQTTVTGMGPPRFGRLPLAGNLRLCAGGSCATALEYPSFAIGGGLAHLSGSDGTVIGALPLPPLPLFSSAFVSSWGVTGSPAKQMVVDHTPSSQGRLRVLTATATVSGSAPAPLRQGPSSGTSTTVQPGGLVQAVVPFAVVSAATGGLTGGVGYARLSVDLVPEPSRGLSLAAAAAGLAWLARRRARRKR